MKYLIYFLFALPVLLKAQTNSIPAGGLQVIGSTPMTDFTLNISSGAAEEKKVECRKLYST